ncbi:hypothetical protein D3C78_1971140 [compost metagenome]
MAELLTVALPVSAMALSIVVAPVTSRVVPAASERPLLPRLPSLATLSVPALMVVPA